MRVDQLGEGTPEVAVVGGIHGDEPCGVRAVERLRRDAPPVEEPVKLVVANEEALAAGVRYVDTDLNRAFDGDDGNTHEGRLARRLADVLEGCTALAIHSTRSTADPFGIVNGLETPVAAVCPALSVAAVVDVDEAEGRPFALDAADLLEVEAGFQGSDEAAENAYRIAREFLTAAGALPGETAERSLPAFRLGDPVEKPAAESYEVFVENFARVEAGDVFAAADGEKLVAESSFYPILMSADGYADIFGYTGDRIGVLDGASLRRESP